MAPPLVRLRGRQQKTRQSPQSDPVLCRVGKRGEEPTQERTFIYYEHKHTENKYIYIYTIFSPSNPVNPSQSIQEERNPHSQRFQSQIPPFPQNFIERTYPFRSIEIQRNSHPFPGQCPVKGQSVWLCYWRDRQRLSD